MKLRRVRRGQWDVLAMCGPRGECPLLDFLAGLEANLEADGRALLRALWFAADHGPPRNVEVSHKIAGEIWEFIAGRLLETYTKDPARRDRAGSGRLRCLPEGKEGRNPEGGGLPMKPQSFSELYERAEEHEDYWLAGAILEFTEAVVREMERQGISRTDLARRLGTTPAYVTKILRGKVNFTLATMMRLARALDSEMHVQLVGPAQEVGQRARAR